MLQQRAPAHAKRCVTGGGGHRAHDIGQGGIHTVPPWRRARTAPAAAPSSRTARAPAAAALAAAAAEAAAPHVSLRVPCATPRARDPAAASIMRATPATSAALPHRRDFAPLVHSTDRSRHTHTHTHTHTAVHLVRSIIGLALAAVFENIYDPRTQVRAPLAWSKQHRVSAQNRPVSATSLSRKQLQPQAEALSN